MYLETERLVLRPWQDTDRPSFAAMNADPEVMRFFPSVLTRTESDALMDRAIAKQKNDGFCFAPIEEKATGEFLGFVGLSRPAYAKPLPFDPCVEIGWRLDRRAWGKGLATEAARAWLRFGFETLELEEIVSFTASTNLRSQQVMKRLNMRYRADDDFLHPALAEGHPLQPHVLFRLPRAAWSGGVLSEI